jgi:hypothetical protein
MANTAAITCKKTRRQNDRYFTPREATLSLLNEISIHDYDMVLECCHGAGNITNVLNTHTNALVYYTEYEDNMVLNDATKDYYWDVWKTKELNWVITNPPFNLAHQIVPKAFQNTLGGCAFLLRLSWLEPCKDRAEFLSEHPPNKVIVLPRISFTGDGKTDSTTCAWFVWEHGSKNQTIKIVPKQ